MQQRTIILAYAFILPLFLSFKPAIAQQEDLNQLTKRFDKLLPEQYKAHEPVQL